jgi:hypothetical protein
MPPIVKKSRRLRGAAGLAMTIGFLLAGLWPFNFSPKNRASWGSGGNGLYFDGTYGPWKQSVGGIALSKPLMVSSSIPPAEKGSFTIAIQLQPALNATNGVPHILSLVEKSGKELLYLGQWKNTLIVKWFGSEQRGKRTLNGIGAGGALLAGRASRLVLSSNQTNTSLYVNGEPAEDLSGIPVLEENGSIRGCSVFLGNSPDAKNAWTGTILALAVYEKAVPIGRIVEDGKLLTEPAPGGEGAADGLIAAFDLREHRASPIHDSSGNGNSLWVPDRITVKNDVLEWPHPLFPSGPSRLEDVATNILGFVFLGFVYGWWFSYGRYRARARSYLVAVLLGGLVSLAIEVIQARIPARDSSLLDFVCNVVGTMLGVLAYHIIRRWIAALANGPSSGPGP